MNFCSTSHIPISLTESAKRAWGLPQFSLEQGTFLASSPTALRFVVLFPLVVVVCPRRGSIQSVKLCVYSWQSPLKWIFKNVAWTGTVRSLAAAFRLQRSSSFIFRLYVCFIFSYQDCFLPGNLSHSIFNLVLLGICKSNM